MTVRVLGTDVRVRRVAASRDEGASAVEFALVSLLLIVIVFGIIEFSLLLRDAVSVTSAVRAAARVASAEPLAGPGICPTNQLDPNEPPCTPASSPALAQDAANAIERTGLALPKDSIDELWVYKANAQGFPGGTTDIVPGTCTSANNCVRFRWVDGQGFRYVGGGWNSTTINACPGANPGSDAVGVYLKATHRYLTGLFGATTAVSDRAVLKFEPQDPDQCAAGTHP